MTGLWTTFLDAAGEPCSGTVTLTPLGVRGSSLDDTILGNTRVTLKIDDRGDIDADVEPGDYRLDIRLQNAETVTRQISIPGGNGIDLKELLNEYAPTPSETTTAFTGSGLYSYEIPWWATSVDVVLVGAGGGGDNGVTLAVGDGGGSGSWATRTLDRGDNIPWESTIISGAVGAGGAPNEGNGAATTATAAGMSTLTAIGGIGGAATDSDGESPGERTFNSALYAGGEAQESLGENGNAPGGGGAGGALLGGTSGAGADGAAYFRAYR